MKVVILLVWAMVAVVLGVILATNIALYPDLTTWQPNQFYCLVGTALWVVGGLWFGARG